MMSRSAWHLYVHVRRTACLQQQGPFQATVNSSIIRQPCLRCSRLLPVPSTLRKPL